MVDAIVSFLAADIRTAVPILLAALGYIFSERAGMVNIGAEGTMLIGALAGVVGSYLTSSVWLGALVSMFFGALISLLFAYLTITVKAEQIVVGAAINIMGLGLTTFVARIIFGVNTPPPKIESFASVLVPGLAKIPLIGPVLFQQSALVYITLLLVPLAHFVLFKTKIGLEIRAVGEHPKACDTVGINVNKLRYGSVIFSGLLAGLAGSYVSIGLLNFFTENMIAGRGFSALAAVIFGNFSPLGALGASLLFGAGDALQFRLQASGSQIPFPFLLMVPYILTILALTGFVRKSKAPAASGVPYSKE